MRLRTLCILFLTVFLLAGWPHSGYSASKVIAAVMSSDLARHREAHRSFVKSLSARGYTSATTEILLQTPNADQLSWSNTIRKFNAYKPDVIVAYGAPAATVAIKESDGIPVVSVDVYSTERPAKGMYGVSSRVPMITLLKTLQDIRAVRKIGIVYSKREVGSHNQTDDVRKLAVQMGFSVNEANVTSPTSLETALTSLLEQSEVLVVTESTVACRNFERIVTRAKARGVPIVSTMPDAAEKGALVSLEINPQEQGYLAAEMVVRILEGASPNHLTLLTPRRVDLIINMRSARELGITLPFSVLGNATRIIK